MDQGQGMDQVHQSGVECGSLPTKAPSENLWYIAFVNSEILRKLRL